MNNIYALYVWDDSQKNFVQVKCDEMLSAIEAYDGYLMNWQKAADDYITKPFGIMGVPFPCQSSSQKIRKCK